MSTVYFYVHGQTTTGASVAIDGVPNGQMQNLHKKSYPCHTLLECTLDAQTYGVSPRELGHTKTPRVLFDGANLMVVGLPDIYGFADTCVEYWGNVTSYAYPKVVDVVTRLVMFSPFYLGGIPLAPEIPFYVRDGCPSEESHYITANCITDSNGPWINLSGAKQTSPTYSSSPSETNFLRLGADLTLYKRTQSGYSYNWETSFNDPGSTIGTIPILNAVGDGLLFATFSSDIHFVVQDNELRITVYPPNRWGFIFENVYAKLCSNGVFQAVATERDDIRMQMVHPSTVGSSFSVDTGLVSKTVLKNQNVPAVLTHSGALYFSRFSLWGSDASTDTDTFSSNIQDIIKSVNVAVMNDSTLCGSTDVKTGMCRPIGNSLQLPESCTVFTWNGPGLGITPLSLADLCASTCRTAGSQACESLYTEACENSATADCACTSAQSITASNWKNPLFDNKSFETVAREIEGAVAGDSSSNSAQLLKLFANENPRLWWPGCTSGAIQLGEKPVMDSVTNCVTSVANIIGNGKLTVNADNICGNIGPPPTPSPTPSNNNTPGTLPPTPVIVNPTNSVPSYQPPGSSWSQPPKLFYLIGGVIGMCLLFGLIALLANATEQSISKHAIALARKKRT